LIKGLFCIHFLEGDNAVLNHFLSIQYKEFTKEKSYYSKFNVIVFNEENPIRMFDKWYADNVYQPGPTISPDIDKSDQQIQEKTWDIYNNICEAGKRHA
jgi:hypothetical protein